MKIAILQIDTIVGDIAGNAAKIRNAVETLPGGVDLAITGELALLGYPPKDLLLSDAFIDTGKKTLDALAARFKDGPALLVGTALPNPEEIGKPLINAAVLVKSGEIRAVVGKRLIPSYDVFDEERYFASANPMEPISFGDGRLGITICEDIWNDVDFWKKRRYSDDPVEAAARKGATVVINISASPFVAGKQQLRERMLGGIAKKYSVPIIYVNQVGGNDDLVFDGRSSVFSKEGKLAGRLKAFDEDTLIVDTADWDSRVESDNFEKESEVWRALVSGTRDYMRKSGFTQAILGISGGIDSALTAAVAVEAIGAMNVTGIFMPSRYTSEESRANAHALSRSLGIGIKTVDIDPILETYAQRLPDEITGKINISWQNIQTRIRGNILMAVSNARECLVLTTGNKSEMAVGYCTLYGDMAGGLSVIGDLYKTNVYAISNWLNKTRGEVIPEAIIRRVPTAELLENQKDEDDLPQYDTLDAVLALYLENHLGKEDMVKKGFAPQTVERIIRMVEHAEFKRKQSAVILKVTSRAFGSGWRMPIVKGSRI